jgi:methyl-accepting chemotaxis protein
MVFQGIFSIVQLAKVKQTATEIEREWLPSIRLLGEIDRNINEIRRIELADLNAKTAEEHESFSKRTKAAVEKNGKQSSDYEKMLSSEEEKKIFEQTKMAIAAYFSVNAKVAVLIREGKDDEAYSINRTESKKTFGAVQEQLSKLTELNSAGATATGKRGDLLYISSRNLIGGILVVALVIGVILTIFISRAISKPLRDLADKAEQIADGNLNITVSVTTTDEVGKLSGAFSTMVANLRDVIGKVRETSAQVSSASIELSSTSEQIATGSEEVAAQASTVATAAEEMSATTSDIARNCHDAADSANKASQAAQAGSTVVEQTVVVMKRIAAKVQETASKVANLGQQSDQIGEIVGTIEDIADQTNLLALNAAIEAARAGEQGRGFAVVADEVRALAERTTKATKEIGDMIKNIQNETKRAVVAMEEGVNEVANGTSEAEKSGQALYDILTLANAVTEQASQIATAAEQQTATTQEISSNIHQITNVVHQSSSSAQQSAGAAHQLAEMAEVLQTLVSRFKLAA